MIRRPPQLLGLLLIGCTGGESPAETDDTPVTDFGGVVVPLADDCAGIAGLSGQALLDHRSDGYTTTLSYVTADAQYVDPTALTVAVTWPASPEATCYPAWDEAPLYTATERVGIHGLTLNVTTADGHFTESLDATAWFISYNGTPGSAYVAGVTRFEGLHGDWVPFPEYGDGTGTTMDFVVVLPAPPAETIQGSVDMGGIPLDRMEAGVFGSRFAVATWPH